MRIIFTGVKQKDVDKASPFIEVLYKFVDWAQKLDISHSNTIFVTCGDWDLDMMIPSQCDLVKTGVPKFMESWINLKKEFCRIENTQIKRTSNDLTQMLQHFGLKFEGKLHSARDDVTNLSNIVKELVYKGKLQPSKPSEMTEIMPSIEFNGGTESLEYVGSKLSKEVSVCLTIL